MTVPGAESRFDPWAVLAAFQRAEAEFVVTGRLARVIRGSDDVTYGVDICPSLVDANRPRVQAALDELRAEIAATGKARKASKAADQPPVLEFSTVAGSVKIVSTPAGVPRGYDALRPGATVERLGGGPRSPPRPTCSRWPRHAGYRKTWRWSPSSSGYSSSRPAHPGSWRDPPPGTRFEGRRSKRPGVSSEVAPSMTRRGRIPTQCQPNRPLKQLQAGIRTRTSFKGGSPSSSLGAGRFACELAPLPAPGRPRPMAQASRRAPHRLPARISSRRRRPSAFSTTAGDGCVSPRPAGRGYPLTCDDREGEAPPGRAARRPAGPGGVRPRHSSRRRSPLGPVHVVHVDNNLT